MQSDDVSEITMPVDSSFIPDSSYISLLEQQLIDVKLQLADAKTSEDRLRLELSKVKLECVRLGRENEKLRRKMNENEYKDDRLKDGNCNGDDTEIDAADYDNVALKPHAKMVQNIHSDQQLVTTYDSPFHLQRPQFFASRMPNVPSCASGIALLYDAHSLQLQHFGVCDNSSNSSLSSLGKSIKRRPPSCASAIAFLHGVYSLQSVSSMPCLEKLNSSNCDFGRGGAPDCLVASTSGLLLSSFQERPRRSSRSTAGTSSATQPRSKNASTSMYDHQRNSEWRDDVVPMANNLFLKKFDVL